MNEVEKKKKCCTMETDGWTERKSQEQIFGLVRLQEEGNSNIPGGAGKQEENITRKKKLWMSKDARSM